MNISKISRSEGQLNRLARRAMYLLKWIAENLGREDFTLSQILDDMPLEEAVSPTVVEECTARAKRLRALFDSALAQGLIQPTGKSYTLTKAGESRVYQASMKLVGHVYYAGPLTGDTVRWSTLGGKPFDESRTNSELVDDLLLKLYGPAMGELEVRDHRFDANDLLGELYKIARKQRTRRQHLAERARTTAAYNWLESNNWIESLEGDGVYIITLKGDQWLESAA